MTGRETAWPEWEGRELIGVGGWSRVYRAVRRDQPEVQCAVKEMEIPAEDAERVLEEIRLMKQFEGTPHIVHIEDYVIGPERDGSRTVSIRMELLKTLRAYLEEHQATEAELLRMGMELCEGLALCHRKGIVHGDLKPANILVLDSEGAEPVFKLGDFGLAGRPGTMKRGRKTEPRLKEPKENGDGTPDSGEQEETEKTLLSWVERYLAVDKGAKEALENEIWINGTPEYLAPEQMGGYRDARSDLYSLGLVIYQFLNNGRLPFLGTRLKMVTHEDRMEALLTRLNGTALPPAEHASEPTMAVLWKACAFQPENRYDSAEAFRAGLEKAIQTPGVFRKEKQAQEHADSRPEEQSRKERQQEKTGKPGWLQHVSRGLLIAAAALILWGLIQNGIRYGNRSGEDTAQITPVPLQAVKIQQLDEIDQGLVALDKAWKERWNAGLPDDLAELPLIMDAKGLLPAVRWAEEDGRIRAWAEEPGRIRGILLEDDQMQSRAMIFSREEDCWTYSMEDDWKPIMLYFAMESFQDKAVDYYMDLSSGQLRRILINIKEQEPVPNLNVSGQFAAETGEAEGWMGILKVGNEIMQVKYYDGDGKMSSSKIP